MSQFASAIRWCCRSKGVVASPAMPIAGLSLSGFPFPGRPQAELSMAQSSLTPRERVPYQPIIRGRRFALPQNARVAVWTIVNVENWLPESAMPRTVLPPPMGQPLLPDVPNWCWHEYGLRVGFWRFLDVLQSRRVRATFAVSGSACSIYPEICGAARDASWEFIGHGFVQKPLHRVEDEADAIASTIEAIRK